ncbi:MAG: ComF family protein [Candidatus Cloacimonetes bacterium]|jgi:competence protein ComFC|nr:ComF family protein [Candidatus Cloacimonadota bacterium]
MKLLQTFIGLFFPKICLSCDEQLLENEQYLCSNCFESLKFLENICPICGAPKTEDKCNVCQINEFLFAEARSVFMFNKVVQNLIHEFKYNEMTKIAKFLGKLSQEYIEKFQPFDHIDYVAPVPLHKVKKRSRGFNQSELLTREISKKMNWEHLPNLIERKRFTETQTKLNKEQRRKNVSFAFKINSKYNIKGKNILLVDDVFTTGATANSITVALKEKQVNKVYVFTIARAL